MKACGPVSLARLPGARSDARARSRRRGGGGHLRCVQSLGALGGLVVAAALSSCTCAKSAPAIAEDSGGAAAAKPAAVDAGAAAQFSAPIAATRIVGGAVLVAGLVVPRATIAVTRIEPGGRTAFTVDILRDVKWSQDVELRLYPAADGAVAVWRGLVQGKTVRQMVTLGPRGEVKGAPLEIGAAACATEDEMAWTERGNAGITRVRARKWAGTEPRDVASVAAERDPLLICGAHRVLVLGEGENDMTLSTTASLAPLVVMRAKDFGDDEARDHGEYTVGDDLGIVRVASSGALAFRELRGDALGPWKKLTRTIARDDDVVAADGDARSAMMVYTRDDSERCGADAGGLATSVHAVQIDRATGAEALVEIAPAECGKDLGPFWTGSAGGKMVVAWAERVPKRDATSAPIAGLAFRTLDGKAATPVTHLARPADAIVDAGCDKERCYAVALARAPGTDDMLPEVAQVITYP